MDKLQQTQVMKRTIITTKDGSKTIHLPEWNESYHSHHGAFQEALHVFIEMGLKEKLTSKAPLAVLEVGFGTGLNAMLTYIEATQNNTPIQYTSLEAYPVKTEEMEALAYGSHPIIVPYATVFENLHHVPWNEQQVISPHFSLTKLHTTLHDFIANNNLPAYDLIYFDAFGPRVQPELWEREIFEGMYKVLLPGGTFVTYCAKGQVRRDLQSVGFLVEKLPGPPGKREMLRAGKGR